MATYSDVIAGLQLFASKQEPGAHIGGAAHDVIWGAPSDIELTDAEKAQLHAWGWRVDNSADSWFCFV